MLGDDAARTKSARVLLGFNRGEFCVHSEKLLLDVCPALAANANSCVSVVCLSLMLDCGELSADVLRGDNVSDSSTATCNGV